MSDPAIEAGRRVMGSDANAYEVAVAREALKPIRKLHAPLFVSAQDTTGDDHTLCMVCRNERGYRVDWPCDTARLIYTTDELEQP